MAVYVGALFGTTPVSYWPHKQACQMTADTNAELYEMAETIGLSPGWFRGPLGSDGPYFYLTKQKRAHALAAGAEEGKAQPGR